ncbi:MAG: polysaccharide biosynthesis protein [Egibacteraceae bacterium]
MSGRTGSGALPGGRTGDGPVFPLLARFRPVIQIGVDVLAWAAALTFATMARYDFEAARVSVGLLVLTVLLAGAAQAWAGLATGLYLGRRQFGSFEEVAVLAQATAVVTAVLFVANWLLFTPQLVPRSAVLGGGVAALLLMGCARYAWRLFIERRRRPKGDDARRLLVFGAGDGGVQIVKAMLTNPSSPYVPVALLDDDTTKRYLTVKGVRVVGTRHTIGAAAETYQAGTLLIAVPTADAALVRDLSERARAAGLDVRVLPTVGELLDERVGVEDIRPVSEADLLGRHEINTDVGSIAGYLTGKRVLVTGAGGSIGSELCRQIDRFAPAELLLADRDESALHSVQLSLRGHAALDGPDVLLLDIREAERVDEVFAARGPQVVFHAAALKHVTALEAHPGEAVKTNVFGTINVLEAARRHGVERFVNISTDKAANPCSVLGYTKRIAERLTAWYAGEADGTYLSVRFGNVLGSRGSVLSVFREQVAAGGPVTVTHPDVTRFFLTVEEAVQLVIQAGAIGSDGQALVLDMGQPVRIADVARRLLDEADRPAEILYTGLRPGEKLHEQLFAEGERDHRPAHPLVSHVVLQCLRPGEIRSLATMRPPSLVAKLRELTATERPIPPTSHTTEATPVGGIRRFP